MATARSILVSGIGIAGPTLAYWLDRFGFNVTLVEQAPALRTGGYMIDFWGAGFDIAEKMGLLPKIHERGYQIDEVRFVNARGHRTGGFSARRLRSTLRNRFISLQRSDLSKLLYETLDGVEVMFADSVTGIDASGGVARVTFENAPLRQFDLVIGADGLHSNIRDICFGDEPRFERRLGYYAASFSVDGYPHRDPTAYVSYTAPGRQVARYALRDNRTAFFFVFVAPDGGHEPPQDLREQKALLRHVYGDDGWECPQILQLLDASGELYFDDVSQIRMQHWSRGRIALVGDACACPSLLAGQGASLGMAGAYVLAGELRRTADDPLAAFARYETQLKGFMTTKQDSAAKAGSWFAPRTRLGIFLRDEITWLMRFPILAGGLSRLMLRDDLSLPSYES